MYIRYGEILTDNKIQTNLVLISSLVFGLHIDIVSHF